MSRLMSRTDFLGWTGTLALAAAVAFLILRPAVGERWFSLYGAAAIALPLALAGGLLLARRFRDTGRSPWRAALFTLPLLAVALAQIGYWSVFFSLGSKGVGLAVLRAVLLDYVGAWLPLLAAALFLFFAWLFVSAAREPAT